MRRRAVTERERPATDFFEQIAPTGVGLSAEQPLGEAWRMPRRPRRHLPGSLRRPSSPSHNLRTTSRAARNAASPGAVTE